MHNSYKSALALHILFSFLHSLYICSSPYSTRGTHYRLIEYITFGVLLCVTHSDHLAVPTNTSKNCAIIPMQIIIRRSSKRRRFPIQILYCLLLRSMPRCLHKTHHFTNILIIVLSIIIFKLLRAINFVLISLKKL